MVRLAAAVTPSSYDGDSMTAGSPMHKSWIERCIRPLNRLWRS
jgi:hypothetical protein